MESKEVLLKQIEENLLKLQEKHKVSFKESFKIIEKRKQDQTKPLLPVDLFSQRKLSSFEVIVKYLKENKILDYKEISLLTGRSYDCVAVTYRNTKKKHSKKITANSNVRIPITIFSENNLSVLENIIVYLKESLKKKFVEIAFLINRDQRTVWTVYSRANKKRGDKK
jgi:hypothetical protein